MPWLLIPAATIALYWPVLTGSLLMDDAEHLTPAGLRSWSGLARIWYEFGATPHYYPLLNSMFWLEHHLWGEAVVGYHLANVLQHALSACLVTLLMRRLRLPGAWLAGAIFALHPVSVESVAWISEQKNTLSTALGLGAALAFLRYEDTGERPRYWLASGLFLAALLTKTVVAVIPPALLVIAWWRDGRIRWQRHAAPLIPWLVAGAAMGLLSAWFERVHSHAQGEAFQVGFAERALIAARAGCFYVRTLVWPDNLMFINPRWSVDSAQALDYGPVALVLAAGIGALLAARRWRGPLAAYLLFLGMLFPVLGFLDINWFNFSYVADHFQYLPSLALIVSFSAVATRALNGRLQVRAVTAAAVGLVIVLGAVARPHVRAFASPRALYADTIAKNPSSWLAHNNLGVVLLDEPGQLDAALQHFHQAVELKPDHARAHNNYATALSRADRLAEAIAHYRRSIELQGSVAEVHFNLGQSLVAAQAPADEALAAFDRALALRPNYLEAMIRRAEILADLPGRNGGAIATYRAALAMAPERADIHHALGLCLSREPGGIQEAAAHYREAIRMDAGFVPAYNNLASLLANDPTTRNEAVGLLQQALVRQPDYVDARFNLGVMLAQLPGRKAEAIRELRLAAEGSPNDAEILTALAGLLAETAGGENEAQAIYRRALALDPKNAAARAGLRDR